MIEHIYRMHYPEGDQLDVARPLPYGQLLDLNGNTLPLPLPTAKMIAYRVRRISTEETRNEYITHYYLEQVYPPELASYL